MSPKSAGLAAKWGHKTPQVYVGGFPDWKKSGHPVLPTAEYLTDGNVVVIDLRTKAVAEKGFLPGAVNLPLAELEDAEDTLPKSPGAQIYLYADTTAAVRRGVAVLKEHGYKNVIGINDALDWWKKSGHELATGEIPVPDDDHPIVWKKKLGKGEISITDFTRALNSELIFIVDARTPAEYESGHFPGSVSIPLEQMQARMSEIPKDKFIVVHCKTGGRGEIGYHLLKKNDYAVKFLNAECECALNGEFTIW